jgi:hypothetical protein
MAMFICPQITRLVAPWQGEGGEGGTAERRSHDRVSRIARPPFFHRKILIRLTPAATDSGATFR